MRPNYWVLAPVSCGVLWLIAIGCAGSGDKGRSSETVVTASKSDDNGLLPRKKANLPELPDGAGKMDDDAPDEFKATANGLYYRVLRKGNKHRPRPHDKVAVHYRGWLDNGDDFDSSYERGKPTEFFVNKVVPGWTEGLQLIGEGGMIELEVPPRLGYGPLGFPPKNSGVPQKIPGNATLHFIVELKKIM